MTTELLLVRHAESEGNAGRSKDPDCPLTDRGREQAKQIARRLSALDLAGFAALTSPYLRARQTAEEIALSTGLQFDEEDAVREWGPAVTLRGRPPYPPEPVGEVVRRLESFLRRHRGRRLLVVSHAAPIALLTQLAWGEPPTTEGDFWAGVSNCCLRWLKATCPPDGATLGQ